MILPTLEVEKEYWQKGFKYIVGIDEVGRGSWAGPLVAAGVIFSTNFTIPKGLRDSKLLDAKRRDALSVIIKRVALSYVIVEIPLKDINKIGIGKANQMAFRKILSNIKPQPDFTLVDAFQIKHLAKSRQLAIIKGDQKSATIAAASIIAKVERDNIMKNLSKNFPNYGFGEHMGYGTKKHQAAIQKFGLCELHRKNYDLDFLFS